MTLMWKGEGSLTLRLFLAVVSFCFSPRDAPQGGNMSQLLTLPLGRLAHRPRAPTRRRRLSLPRHPGAEGKFQQSRCRSLLLPPPLPLRSLVTSPGCSVLDLRSSDQDLSQQTPVMAPSSPYAIPLPPTPRQGMASRCLTVDLRLYALDPLIFFLDLATSSSLPRPQIGFALGPRKRRIPTACSAFVPSTPSRPRLPLPRLLFATVPVW